MARRHRRRLHRGAGARGHPGNRRPSHRAGLERQGRDRGIRHAVHVRAVRRRSGANPRGQRHPFVALQPGRADARRVLRDHSPQGGRRHQLHGKPQSSAVQRPQVLSCLGRPRSARNHERHRGARERARGQEYHRGSLPGRGQGGIKKFQDGLPVLCIPTANFSECTATDNNLGQHIPIAVPDTTTFSMANGFSADTDYYVIAVVQHRERMSSSLPASGTLLREYVQLETPANASFSKHVALQTDLLDGTSVPTRMPDGSQAYAVDDPHFLGPVIVATRDRAVRIVFYNLLPTGSEGDLFLPTDSTVMGSGMGPTGMPDPADDGTVMDGVRNPMCSEYPKPAG